MATAGTTGGLTVGKAMRSMPVTSGFFSNAYVRADGRVVYDLNLMAIKAKAASQGRFDLYGVTGSVRGDEVFRPLAEGDCPFLR